jgi:hypothetical protein
METKQSNNRQKLILLALLAIIIIGLIFFLLPKPHTNPYGNQIPITNLKSVIPNLPQDRIDAISTSLYNRVSSLYQDDLSDISAIVREDSAENNFDSGQELHYGNFIVDIAAVKYSFKVYFEWADNPNNPNLSGYAVVINCLPENQLIYGTFPCQDDTSTTDPINDSITKHLPFMNTDFSIKLSVNDQNAISLVVELFFVSWDYDESGQPKPAAIARQKKLVADWFTSRNLDLHKYTINYKY